MLLFAEKYGSVLVISVLVLAMLQSFVWQAYKEQEDSTGAAGNDPVLCERRVHADEYS